MMLSLATFAAASADEGMWLLNKPPTGLLKERYGFEPTPAWLEHLQKSCVRIGASGSFVSPDGLLLTNHHVGSDQLFKLSTPGRDLMKDGFYARTQAEELKCPDLEVRVLWAIEDVTDRIDAAVKSGLSPADAYLARRKAMTVVEQEAKDATKLDCQVVTLYHGARYHLYKYRRYTDVRLVMAPEKGIAFFGGDTDNFEYPRFDLDCCFFRVYDNGQPLKVEHYLKWSQAGAKEGELIFVLGHPGRTRRLFTVEHLKFLRDVEMPTRLRQLWRREVQLSTFCNRNDEHARIGEDDFFTAQNSRKFMTGALAGLLDPALMGAKAAEEKKLQAEAPSKGADGKANAWERLAKAENTYREFYLRYRVLGSIFSSDLFFKAQTLVRLADELPKPSPDRLREYRDSELDSLYVSLYSPAPIYDALETEGLASGLSQIVESLGGDDPAAVTALAGLAPQARAEQLVAGCTFKDIAERKRLVKEGKQAIESSKDPLIQLARALDPEARALRKRFEDEIESIEREAYADIAAARFAAYGESVYPDATGTLRFAFGTVKGYTEGGQQIPPFTTYEGMYRRSKERRGQFPFELPQRWLAGKDKLALDTPLNFIMTADIIGGNSGSPVVNKAGEITGLIFDGNLQSLPWDFAFSDTQGRAMAVDCRAIIEALRKVYNAGRLADELVGK